MEIVPACPEDERSPAGLGRRAPLLLPNIDGVGDRRSRGRLRRIAEARAGLRAIHGVRDSRRRRRLRRIRESGAGHSAEAAERQGRDRNQQYEFALHCLFLFRFDLSASPSSLAGSNSLRDGANMRQVRSANNVLAVIRG